MASRCGYSADLSQAVNDRAVYNIDNAYIKGYANAAKVENQRYGYTTGIHIH